MVTSNTITLTANDKKLLIASVMFSITTVKEKLFKYSNYASIDDMDEREKENYTELRTTLKTYKDMLEDLKAYC